MYSSGKRIFENNAETFEKLLFGEITCLDASILNIHSYQKSIASILILDDETWIDSHVKNGTLAKSILITEQYWPIWPDIKEALMMFIIMFAVTRFLLRLLVCLVSLLKTDNIQKDILNLLFPQNFHLLMQSKKRN